MVAYSAQGSITIRKLRSGDTYFISLGLNGKPLYQGVDPTTGAVSPDWTVAENQPIITPNVQSSLGNAVTLSFHAWRYNGVELTFNGDQSDGWTTDSTGTFRMNSTTGALRIIGNLASETNIASDTLEYSCVATSAGVEYNLTKSIDVTIQQTGASAYYGYITLGSDGDNILTAERTSVQMTAHLMVGGTEVGDFYVKWYKDDTLWSEKNGQKTVTATRDDVNGMQIFIAEFYTDQTATSAVARGAVYVNDSADQFIVVMSVTSSNKEVTDDSPVTITAKVVKMSDNSVVDTSGMTWRIDIMDKDTWTVIKTASANTISISASDMGTRDSVEAVGEASWN